MSLLDQVRLLQRNRISDARGWFLKVVTGTEEGLAPGTGEVYLTEAQPGQVRGNHYHPLANELFTVVRGDALLVLSDAAGGERREILLSGADPVTVLVPAGVAHAFLNRAGAAEPMLLVAYSDRLYCPADTVPLPLIPESVDE